MAVVIMSAVATILGYLLSDILYAWIDPRHPLRLGRQQLMGEQTTAKPVNLCRKKSIYVSESLWATAMRRLRRDHLTQIAMVTIALLALLSIFAPLISEHILHVESEPDRHRQQVPGESARRDILWARTTWAATIYPACSMPGRFRWASVLARRSDHDHRPRPGRGDRLLRRDRG
jgi:hypothetical protein